MLNVLDAEGSYDDEYVGALTAVASRAVPDLRPPLHERQDRR